MYLLVEILGAGFRFCTKTQRWLKGISGPSSGNGAIDMTLN